MRRLQWILVTGALICPVPAASVAAATQMYFEESIDPSATVRLTRSGDGGGPVFWTEVLPGDPAFGVATDYVAYQHSVAGIDPPVIPDGTVLTLRLKLFITNASDKEIVLTVEAQELDKVHRRHFLIGPALEDSVIVQETILRDGSVTLAVESRSGRKFKLNRSLLDMTYRPAVATDAGDRVLHRPGSFALAGNYPNPFNPATTIEYTLKAAAAVEIEIFNARGALVRSLVSARLPAGRHGAVWNGTDDAGRLVASGVYLYRISADGRAGTRSMVLLK